MVFTLMQLYVDASSNIDANLGNDVINIILLNACLIARIRANMVLIVITCMTKPGRVPLYPLLAVIGGVRLAIDLLREARVERENLLKSGVVLRLGGPAKPRERARKCLVGMADR